MLGDHVGITSGQALDVLEVLLVGLLVDPGVLDLDFLGLERLLLLLSQQRVLSLHLPRRASILAEWRHALLASLVHGLSSGLGRAADLRGIRQLPDAELLDLLPKFEISVGFFDGLQLGGSWGPV